MATSIQKCNKCDRARTGTYLIQKCGHTICKECLPNAELGSFLKCQRKVFSVSNPDHSIYRYAQYFPSTHEDGSPRHADRSSEPPELVNPTPGDCPVCQQRILCENMTLNVNLVTFHEFDWIKQVHERLGPKTCAECPEGQVQEGKYHCLKCDRILCEKCQRVHHPDGGHHPLPLDDIANRNLPFNINLNRGFDPLYCGLHPNQKLSHFCKGCSKPVCRLCLQFHEQEGHELIMLDEGLVEMQKYVKDNLEKVHQYKNMISVEKDKFQRCEIAKYIAELKHLPEMIAACLKPDIDAAIDELSRFKMIAVNHESKYNADIAKDEIGNLLALEKTHEIMHRGKEKNVCSHEERLIRLYSFLKSNEMSVEGAQRSLCRLQRDSATQLPNPVVIYNDSVKQLLRKTREEHLHVVRKERVKGVFHHCTRNHPADGTPPRLVSGTILAAEGDRNVQIVVADANKKVMVFEFSPTKGIILKWEKSQEISATLRSMKELKEARIHQDGKFVIVVDVEGAVCEIGGHRKSIILRKADVTAQGDHCLPANHGYDLPKFLERKGVIPYQVIGFVERDTFLVSGMHTATNKPLIFVSRGGDVDLNIIRPENDRPSRVWMDYEGFIYCANTDANSITRYSPDGRFDREILCAFDHLSRPVDVAVDRQFMYVTEEEGNVKIFGRVPGHVAAISENTDN
ncbi:uncharacterized protein LOC135502473 [Lineus longissimus]|uniref:uncharacterized protein LOC135502473 n=1 Tax=Lineus longissimus TaxID=88925 RepID=UPI00315DA4ED